MKSKEPKIFEVSTMNIRNNWYEGILKKNYGPICVDIDMWKQISAHEQENGRTDLQPSIALKKK